MLNIVLDTNIYLAAMFEPDGFCSLLLRRLFSFRKNYTVYVSEGIYIELHAKMDAYIKNGDFSKDSANDQLHLINSLGYLVKPQEKITAILDDPDDNKILECAVAANANLIVTMDRHLLRLKTFRNIGIITPKMFFYMLPNI